MCIEKKKNSKMAENVTCVTITVVQAGVGASLLLPPPPPAALADNLVQFLGIHRISSYIAWQHRAAARNNRGSPSPLPIVIVSISSCYVVCLQCLTVSVAATAAEQRLWRRSRTNFAFDSDA